VHTVGGVVAAQETIMLIIPHSDKLVVEAKIAPSDVDQIALGAPVSIRVMAGNQRTTPSVDGTVTYIAADLTKEQQSQLTYYVVRAAIRDDQVHRLGDLKLVPGMPAEVFIQTQDRTPLEFLIKPLSEQIARTFRER
jgi:HlyD family secretion protein